MIKNLKISQKLILLILIGSILPLIITSFIGYSSLDSVLTNKISNQIKEKGISKANEVNQWLTARKDEIKATANVPTLRKGATEKERAKYTAYNLYRLKNNHENVYDAQWSTDTFGNFIFAAPDSNGNVKSKSNGSIKDRDYWNKLISGKTIISKPIVSRSTGKLAVVIASPIKGYDGQIKGSVGNNILLTYINNTLKDIGLSDNSFAVLTTENGTYIIHPNEEMIMKKNATSEKDALSKAIVNLNGDNKKELKTINYKDRKKIVYNKNIPESNWTFTIVADYDELFAERKALIQKYILTFILILILVIIIGYIIIINIKRPINDVKNIFTKASSGDLSSRAKINSKDEVGELAKGFNKVMDDIGKLINEVKISANTVLNSSNSLSEITEQTSNATNDVAQTMNEISESANEQAKDTEEGASNINNLANNIQEVSSAIDNISDGFDKTISLNNQGLDIVNILTDKTKENDKANDDVRKSILDVNNSMEEIGTIIDTISQIAEQTNLLALNAAIEAARAGESGKGFAVVSDEIRKLAEESSDSTEQIKNIINNIKAKAENAVDSTNSSREIVKEQAKSVEKTETVFNDISTSVENLTHKVKEINNTSEEMLKNKNKMVNIIENISASSEETSAATQQVSASSEEQLSSMEEVSSYANNLKTLAEKLEDVVNKFKI